MSAVPDNIKNLPISERIQLVEDIWDSIAEDAGTLQLSAEDGKNCGVARPNIKSIRQAPFPGAIFAQRCSRMIADASGLQTGSEKGTSGRVSLV